MADWFLEERGRSVPAADRAWLDAQRAAWLSLWEVTDVVAGERLSMRDLLTGETREIREVEGSKSLVARDTLLARVVDFDGVSLLCGMHPRVLPPRYAAVAVEDAQAKLRRKRAMDRVGAYYVFNIGGNMFRVVAAIHFNRQMLFVRHVFTHAQYDRWKP